MTVGNEPKHYRPLDRCDFHVCVVDAHGFGALPFAREHDTPDLCIEGWNRRLVRCRIADDNGHQSADRNYASGANRRGTFDSCRCRTWLSRRNFMVWSCRICCGGLAICWHYRFLLDGKVIIISSMELWSHRQLYWHAYV